MNDAHDNEMADREMKDRVRRELYEAAGEINPDMEAGLGRIQERTGKPVYVMTASLRAFRMAVMLALVLGLIIGLAMGLVIGVL